MSDAMGDLMSGGAKSAKFTNLADTIEGVVEGIEKRQDEDMQTKKPKTWDNGDPVFIYVVTLQTNQRDDEEDDGMRRIWCRNNLIAAIRTAFREAGLTGKDSPVGGTLKIQYHANGEARRGFSPPKLFRARFTPGARSDGWEETPDTNEKEKGGERDDQPVPF